MLEPESIDDLEEEFPRLACAALCDAATKAKAAGLDIMEVSDDKLFSVSSEGTRTFIKKIAPSVRVAAGTRIRLR